MSTETYLDRIKQIKNQKKITNDKLSEMTGIPLGTLSKLLAGISESPKLSNMVAIAQALGCSLDYLVTGVPENTNNYTLDEAEIGLVEAYRMLDDYGKQMLTLVANQERDRATRQAAEQALLLRNITQPAAQEGGRSSRRRTYTPTSRQVERAVEHSEAYRYQATPVAPVVEKTPISAVSEKTPISAVSEAMPASSSGQGGVILGGVKERSIRRDIPLFDLPVSAGVGEFLAEGSGTMISIPVGDRTAGATFALRISGDSMEPRYQSGDVLLVEKCASVDKGELGIFVLDGAGYFKQYGGDHLVSLNTAYGPIWLKDFERVECCGRVIGKLKRK